MHDTRKHENHLRIVADVPDVGVYVIEVSQVRG